MQLVKNGKIDKCNIDELTLYVQNTSVKMHKTNELFTSAVIETTTEIDDKFVKMKNKLNDTMKDNQEQIKVFGTETAISCTTAINNKFTTVENKINTFKNEFNTFNDDMAKKMTLI